MPLLILAASRSVRNLPARAGPNTCTSFLNPGAKNVTSRQPSERMGVVSRADTQPASTGPPGGQPSATSTRLVSAL